jgi:hypothetical protein
MLLLLVQVARAVRAARALPLLVMVLLLALPAAVPAAALLGRGAPADARVCLPTTRAT